MSGQITFVFLMFIYALATAETPFEKTIDSLYAVALENNPELASVAARQRQAEFKAGGAGWLPDPMVSIAAVNLPRSSLALDETPMSGINLGLSQKIPWPGKLKSQGRIAAYDTDIVNYERLYLENAVSRQIANQYFEFAFQAASERIVDENITLVTALSEVIETRYAHGQGTAHDLLRSLTYREKLENRKLQISQKHQSALLNLARILNDKTILEAGLAVELEGASLVDFSAVTDQVEGHPMALMTSTMIDRADEHYSLARKTYWPDFNVGVDYRIREKVKGDPVQGEDYLTFKLGLNLPLWFFKNQKNKVAAADQGVMAQYENHQMVIIGLQQRLNDAQYRLKSYKESIGRFEEKIIPQAEAAYETAVTAYEVGEIEFAGLIGSLVDLTEIRIESLRFIKNYYQVLAEIAELTGSKFGDIL